MFKRIGRSTVLAALLCCIAGKAGGADLTVAAFESWLARYGAAWETRDASAAGALFTIDARYRETPFEEPKTGRAGIEEYWRGVTADQRDVKFESGLLSVRGATGIAHWSAKFRLASSGATVELDGIFVLEFDASGQCRSLREWWHAR